MLNSAWETITAGLSPWTLRNKADWDRLHKLGEYTPPERDYVQRTLPPRDRLAGVYFSATEHDEYQPIHLQVADTRSEVHTSELQSLMSISYAVFCLKNNKKKTKKQQTHLTSPIQHSTLLIPTTHDKTTTT